MSLIDHRQFHLPGGVPTRKPVPRIVQPDQPYGQGHPPQYPSQRPPSHIRSRTASSSIFPTPTEIRNTPTAPAPNMMNPQHMPPSALGARRSPSNATTSTANTTPNIPVRQNSGSSLQRSTSSRSGSSPTSYVALMRKQKATVWSDRAQHEDPRMLAAQRAARARAAAEVNNSNPNMRASTSGSSNSITGGVRSKIRHHGAPKAREYIQSGLPTSGVPMRLSQNEIDEGDGEDEYSGHGSSGYGLHRRTDSGRSSVGSGGRLPSMYGLPGQGVGGLQPPHSTGSTPPSGSQSRNSPVDKRLQATSAEETPVPDDFKGRDYFARPEAQTRPSAASGDSNGSMEREDSFGQVGTLPIRSRNPDEEAEARRIEAELRRRGSVDERTMTMSGYGKLFIANPDA